jgi:poly(glycerol-phosphate) alpha-glucosyltransferase
MLDPWITGRGRWKKGLARVGYERASWRMAAGFHALTEAEAGDIARESGRQDSLIIANPAPESCSLSGPAGRDLVYIGRIHAKKNLVALVEGWKLAKRPRSARLRIAGWGDEADIAVLRAAVAAGDGSAEFLGPVFGEDKAQLLAEARFVVLPSLSEGLPMAVLEAWAAGRPTLMTRDCNLPQGFAAGAALECGHSPHELARAIEQALALGEPAWGAMAIAARGLAEGPFAAQAIAAQWAKAYASAFEGTDGRDGTA